MLVGHVGYVANVDVKTSLFMGNYRFILEPYKGMATRYHCPSCKNRVKTFTRYIDIETNEHLSPEVGKCSRNDRCGYHYSPKQYFLDNNIDFKKERQVRYIKPTIIAPKPVSYISPEIFKASLKGYEKNHFVKYLINLFGIETTNRLIEKYFIGTSKRWDGATLFWQIDILGKIRTGKIMLYDSVTGKRVKEPHNHITWAHKAMPNTEFELKQCFFGEHLLKDKIKPVAIVESEKTAIISSVYLQKFIWLAAGSVTNLNTEKCKILKGREIFLFPDLNYFDKWKAKAIELSHFATFVTSDLLENKATEDERIQGLDLADFLTRFDSSEFGFPQKAIESSKILLPTCNGEEINKEIQKRMLDNLIKDVSNGFHKSLCKDKEKYIYAYSQNIDWKQYGINEHDFIKLVL